MNFLNPKYFPEIFFEEKIEKKFLLSIDDGYYSFYENAWPFLKKNKIPFIIFLYQQKQLEKKDI